MSRLYGFVALVALVLVARTDVGAQAICPLGVPACCGADADCDDADACTGVETCDVPSGTCTPGTPPVCDDSNPCTDDSCDALAGCVRPNNTAPCEDGDPCTTGDTCSGGTCVPGSASCDDGDGCTLDGCVPGVGCEHVPVPACRSCLGPGDCDDGDPCTDETCVLLACVYLPDTGAACDDRDACTTGDTCAAGACVGGAPPDCADSNPCTDDACNPTSGCAHVDNTAPCSDGNACTTGDTCAGGTCGAGAPTSCDDGDACTADSCVPATGCQHAVIGGCRRCDLPADCDDGNPCTNETCTLHQCVYTPNTAPCDDKNACTTGDTCSGGTCVGGAPPTCNDANPCTDDSCNPTTGCVHTNNTAACNDGNACTTNDTCSGGSCVGGVAPSCNDNDPCTDDSCNPTTGCVHVNNTAPCNDGNACTTGDTCAAGKCVGGAPPNCNDANPCTDDSCSSATGCVHANNTAACNDGDACTTGDTCSGGTCVGGAAPNCNDANPCTNDSCNPASGCAHVNNTLPCNDANACTTGDTCSAGACVGGAAPNCADANPCTDDVCLPLTGCAHPSNTAACNDNNACTTGDVCAGGTCVGGPAPSCDDGNPCTDDGCDPLGGCTHTNNTAPCNDNNACTTIDTCSGGTCVGGVPRNCSDANPCTDDICQPLTGCAHVNNTVACDDRNACTTNDACSGGSCVGGAAPNCSDANPCTDDSCNATTGCVHTNNTVACDDGNACTASDACSGGACVGGPAPNCNDSNPCTNDTCSPATGCAHTNNTLPCSDGNACTTNDTCAGGACVGGAAPNCNDSNPCTNDTCSPATGCGHTNNTLACSDGNACTTNDTCAGGACVGGAAPNCNDGNPCTNDTCSPATGCGHANNVASCSDGDACTTGDTCAAGSCVAGPPTDCDDGDACTADSCLPASGCQHVGIAGCRRCDLPADCDDGNPCTDEACTLHECVFTANAASCDDGNGCTTGDRCAATVCAGVPKTCTALDQCHVAGTCDPGTGVCSNPIRGNGQPCDDGSLCTTPDTCQNGTCTGTAVVCPTPDQCHQAGTCNPTTGTCSNPAAPNDTSCNDGNACTRTDTCQAGVCSGANPVVCATPDQCHSAGTCSPATGVCSNPTRPDGAACNDGSACTKTDTCQAGACTGADPVVCPAPDQCHLAGTCSPATGTCSNPARPDGDGCNDGSACTKTDTCQAGTCTGTDAVVCPTPDQCHLPGTCSAATGLCSNPARPDGAGCFDGSACTQTDTCQAGVCTGASPVVCPAPAACRLPGTCDTTTGLCSAPVAPDDSTCDDLNACTRADTCHGGVCTGANPVVCPLPDQCHLPGTCNAATGVCSNPNRPDGSTCTDLSACTPTDACAAGTCVGEDPVVCRASDQCHAVGTCNPANGVCSDPLRPDGSDCNDGTLCTRADTCEAGTCVGTDPVVCTALDQCHLPGTCTAASGVCSNPTRQEGSTCDDHDGCTVADRCTAGTCGGVPRSCDDGASCSDDSCVDGECRHEVFDARCDTGECILAHCRPGARGADTKGCVGDPVFEGDACTDDGFTCTDDICTDGACRHSAVDARCNTGESCLPAACVPGNGEADRAGCVTFPDEVAGDECVEDDDPCTDDSCAAGSCTHDAVAQKATCDPVRPAWERAKALADEARGLPDRIMAAITPTGATAAVTTGESLAGSAVGLATTFDHVVRILAGRELTAAATPRALASGVGVAQGAPVGFTDTVAQQRARIAFTEIKRTPTAVAGFLRQLGVARERAFLAPTSVPDLRHRGRDLLRGTKALKRDLKSIQRISRAFAR